MFGLSVNSCWVCVSSIVIIMLIVIISVVGCVSRLRIKSKGVMNLLI